MRNNSQINATSGVERKTVTPKFSLEFIDTKDLQPITSIPDYLDPFCCDLIQVAKTPKGKFIIDGQSAIEERESQGYSDIQCMVHELDDHDEVELALMKLTSRILPQGGTARYAELIRNVLRSKCTLEALDGSPYARYQHGGDRRSAKFSDNKTDNINEILSLRTGKSKSTIREYQAHMEFIDEFTINELTKTVITDPSSGDPDLGKRGASKSFFKKIQKRKKELAMKLEADGKNPDEITHIISEKVLAAFRANPAGENLTVFTGLAEFSKPVKSQTTVEKLPEERNSTIAEVVKKDIGNFFQKLLSDPNNNSESPSTGERVKIDAEPDISARESEEGEKPSIPEPLYVSKIRYQGNVLLGLAQSDATPEMIADQIEAVIMELTGILSMLRALDTGGVRVNSGNLPPWLSVREVSPDMSATTTPSQLI